ncbi:hypothetical protein NM208_g10888 [Fusarium decemcellulare]|uniref:Uncharacterized protein n=1 Tax=Fusarium decemcellulare TaxID=57161 RepID=A0ACC1RWS3_9HYPO|nr:hypothetical protein NM208_g10888 [Fusarium decemcellulare]
MIPPCQRLRCDQGLDKDINGSVPNNLQHEEKEAETPGRHTLTVVVSKWCQWRAQHGCPHGYLAKSPKVRALAATSALERGLVMMGVVQYLTRISSNNMSAILALKSRWYRNIGDEVNVATHLQLNYGTYSKWFI